MSELFDSYEQEYSELSSEISRQISQIRSTSGEKRKVLFQKIDKAFTEADENLRNMEIEAHSVPAQKREQLKARLTNFKKDLENSKREYRKIKNEVPSSGASRSELLAGAGGDGASAAQDQRSRLVAASDRLNQSGDRIKEAHRIALETEAVGVDILRNLDEQGNTIRRVREGVQETDSNISRARRLLTVMGRRAMTNKLIMFGIIAVLIGLIILIVYFKFIKN